MGIGRFASPSAAERRRLGVRQRLSKQKSRADALDLVTRRLWGLLPGAEARVD